MINYIRKYTLMGRDAVVRFESEHPYLFAFFISVVILTYAVFRTPSDLVSDTDFSDTDELIFLDMDTIAAPQRLVKKQVSADEGDESAEAADVERATGISEDENAVDISFFPGIVPPRPIGRLPKYYPKIAAENNVEAVVNVELLIASNGIVKNVSVIRVRLTKELPADLKNRIMSEFARDAKKTLLGAQFSPPVVEGKRVPIRMMTPLRFELE